MSNIDETFACITKYNKRTSLRVRKEFKIPLVECLKLNCLGWIFTSDERNCL